MKKLVWMLILCLGMSFASAQELSDLSSKICSAVKIQGTIVGKDIVASAIIDDKIAREGDIFLVDEATGNLVTKLAENEIPQYADRLKVKVIAISHGNVLLQHEGVNLSLEAR